LSESAKPVPAERLGLPDFALLTTVLLWSTNLAATKDQLELISPLAFTGVRFGLMVLFAFAVLALRSGSLNQTKPRRGDFGRIAISGFTGYTLYQIGFMEGLDRTSLFASSLLLSTVPLWTMLMLRLLGERSPLISWAGLIVAVIGVAIFLVEKRGGDRSFVGDLLSMGAAISFAVYGIVNRPLVRNYPAPTYTAYTMLIGVLPLLVISIPSAREQDWSSLPNTSWLAISYSVVFPVYVAYMLWNYGIEKRGAAIASSFGLLTPIVSGVLSALFFSEKFGILKVIGAILVLAGLLLIRAGPALLQRRSSPAVSG
jgi:drug/metabolite transporter (DMT)-like permease